MNCKPYYLLLLSCMALFSCKKSQDAKPDAKLKPTVVAAVNDSTEVDTLIDIDGNIYQTMTFGTQTWTIQNLKTTHYRDGSSIPNVPVAADWLAQWNTEGDGSVWYNNTPNNLDGLLYNAYAYQNVKNIAPVGWHVPTQEEWDVLSNFVGGNSKSGAILRQQRCTNDLFGFSGRTSGVRLANGEAQFLYRGIAGYFATTSQAPNNRVYTRIISDGSPVLTPTDVYKNLGISVRLVKD